jgi:hypothetical protein
VSDIDTAAADSLKVLDPKRPIREADIPPIHSMTSSALASNEAGIVTPNAFAAALRLMTSTPQVVVDGNGLRQQLAIGQQQKQRVPAQIKFSTHPLCFDFSVS